MRPAPRDHPIGTPVRRASLKIEKTTASYWVAPRLPDFLLRKILLGFQSGSFRAPQFMLVVGVSPRWRRRRSSGLAQLA